VPILDVNGRVRSTRTDEEEEDLLLADIERLPPEEREAVLEIYNKLAVGETKGYRSIADIEYRVAPVSIREFLTDPYFLGETGASLWPQLKDDMVELFEGQYQEALLGGSIGWGKCLESLSFFVDSDSGTRMTIGQAVGKTPSVPSFGGQSIAHERSNRVWKSGRKECARMKLVSGQHLDASLDHPVLCPDGYRHVSALEEGDLVAVARRVPAPQRELEISDDEVVVSAALIADGSMTGARTTYTKGDPNLRAEVVKHAGSIPGFDGASPTTDGKPTISLRGLTEWTDTLGIRCLSKVKRVPDTYFGLSDEQLSLFLRWLFTDGDVYTGSPRKIEICLASEGLIDDIQYLLRRFGVVARKSYKRKKNQDGDLDAWRLQIADAPNQILFMERVGQIPGKEAACDRLLKQARSVKPNSNWDVVPITTKELKEIRRETGLHNKKKWAKLAGLCKGSYMGRQKFVRLCDSVGYHGRFRRFADMSDDIVWERVESVEPRGVRDVYDLSVPATGNAVVNGVVVHNSFFSTTAMAYAIYQMSCLRNPQRAYGIDLGSNIYVAMLSVTEKVAKRVVINELIGKIRHSRYFQEHFPSKEAPSQLEIRFPNNIQVVAGSTGSSAIIGLNVFSGFIDESSFMGEAKEVDRLGREVLIDVGEKIYKSIIRRMKSRFQRVGRLPGVLIVASSKERPNAFIEKRIDQAKESEDPMTFIREYATWEVHPKERFSGKFFKVVVGNERISSRILGPGDEEDEARYRELGLQIVDVPEDYRGEFEADIDSALRDVAGVATDVISQYMSRTEMVYNCQDETLQNPVAGLEGDGPVVEWVAGSPLKIEWNRICNPFVRRLPGGVHEEAWRPKRHPGEVRYVHIDPALTGDSAGLTIGHIAGWTEVVRKDAYGEEYNELAPRMEADLVLRVIPPPGDEIMLADLRGIVYQFMGHGFMVSYSSLDQFQSADTIQQFNKHGIEAEVVSIDRTTEPYDTLKAAIYEGRFRMAPNPIALQEFRYLQRVPKRGGKVKIDHPKRNPDGTPGSKDVADSIAGVVYSLSKKAPGRPVDMVSSSRESPDMNKEDDSWVTGGMILVKKDDHGDRKKSGPQKKAPGGSLPFLRS